MPVKTSNNNRILPANGRAVDVAKRAIQEILPVQQMRYHDAFAVQGYEGVLYNRLGQGPMASSWPAVWMIAAKPAQPQSTN
jgi:hypothetical protein